MYYMGICGAFTLVYSSFINFNIHQNNKLTGVMLQIPAVTVEHCGHLFFFFFNIIGFVHRLLPNVHPKVHSPG